MIMNTEFRETARDLIFIVKPKQMIEIGSWYGDSAFAFLESSFGLGRRLEILCIDTWLGSLEHWNNSFPNSNWNKDSLLISDGEPKIFDEFLKRKNQSSFKEQIYVLRCPSSHAECEISKNWADADLAYIDGSHESVDVKNDLTLLSKVNPKIVLSGDDFDWTIIRFAVLKFALRYRYTIMVNKFGKTYVCLSKENQYLTKSFEKFGYSKFPKISSLLKSQIRILTHRKLPKQFSK